MEFCCSEIPLDYEEVDRELEEVWHRQRYRCLETKQPRRVLEDHQEKILLSVNKDIRGSTGLVENRKQRSTSVPAGRSRPWNAKRPQQRDKKQLRNSIPRQNARSVSRGRRDIATSRAINRPISRSLSLDSREDGLRSRNTGYPVASRGNVGRSHYGGGMSPNYKTQRSPSRTRDARALLPPKSHPYSMHSYNVDRPLHKNENQKFIANKPRATNVTRSRQSHSNRQYVDDRDEYSSYDSKHADLGMGLFW